MVHLHVHSNHSLLEGTAGVRQLVGRAVEHRMSALALTDTAGLYGAIPFYQAAREAGIQPILGVQLNGALLLARNREGYSRMCEIITAYHLGTPENEPFNLLDHLHEDDPLFVVTGDRRLATALHARGLAPLIAITHYGDRDSRYQASRMRDFAHSLKLRPVALSPVYFSDPEHARIHRVVSAIRLNTTTDNLKPGETAPAGAWFRSPREMERLYGDWPETLENTRWVAEHCDLQLAFGTPLFPEFPTPEGETPFSHLWKLAFAGVQERYSPLTPEIAQRLQYELDIIHQLGFAPYFLIVWDIVRHARSHSIPIVGRGSAANSLVAYALGITRADPFKYDLYFERFLNLSRTDCPDIDLDICWRNRDDVIDYVYRTYGAERVAMICTLNTFRARSAVREVAKAFGLPPGEVGRITRLLPHYGAGDIRAVVKFLPESRGLDIEEEPLKSIVEISEFIDGSPRHLSVHPCGVVIAPEPLTRFVPLQRAAKGILITQYDMHPIEDLGLIKMDLLGHRSLTVIDDTVRKVRENRGIEIDIEHLPDPDPLTGELIRTGRTIGCFQIESPAMRALLQNTRADNTDMLIKTLSLVRPGPSGSGMKQRFIARHLGHEETVYLHPALEKVLGDTYGVMLYQEDILKVASVIAGLNLAEGDALRRAMSKKRSPREMAANMKAFLEKAACEGIEEEAAEEIWGLIANFAAYSYCKAHACTYGEIAYQCTYLKAHFPAEFLSSVLSNRGGFYHPAVYVEESRRMGIAVRPPDVNRSDFQYTVEEESIRMGLVEIRNLTRNSREHIVEGRGDEFRSLQDLWRRAGIPYADALALIHAGACDGFGRTRPELLWELRLLAKSRGSAKPEVRGPESAAGEGFLFLEGTLNTLIPQLPDYSRRTLADLEWEALGLLASTHPIEYYLPALASQSLVLSADMADYEGTLVTMVGWLIAERRVGLKERGCMKFLTFEDGCGIFEAVLFPRVYQEMGHLLDSHGPYLVTGEIQDDNHYYSLVVESLERAGGHGTTPGLAGGTIRAAAGQGPRPQ